MIRQKMNRILDALSIICVFLTPFLLIVFFVPMVSLSGAPEWYLAVHGLLLVGSATGLIHLISLGMIRAIRNRREKKLKGE